VRARGHLKLLAVATLVWLGFLAAGAPAYYRQYSTSAMALFEVLLLGPVALAAVLALRTCPRSLRARHALRLAFHFTVPLFVYDLAYCGVLLGHGAGFVFTYWYLTVYYFLPWVIFPAAARGLDRRERVAAAT
jgi:hypothetical protein